MYKLEHHAQRHRPELSTSMNERLAAAVDLPKEIIFMSKISCREILLASRRNGQNGGKMVVERA